MAKILLVDDYPDTATSFAMALTLDGHTVRIAHSAHEGLELFQAARFVGEPFDLLLLDVFMPRMSGLEMAREIRRYDTKVKLAFLSAHLKSVTPQDIQELHVDGVMGKPAPIANLRQLVNELTVP